MTSVAAAKSPVTTVVSVSGERWCALPAAGAAGIEIGATDAALTTPALAAA
jgi:hypothetical protein